MADKLPKKHPIQRNPGGWVWPVALFERVPPVWEPAWDVASAVPGAVYQAATALPGLLQRATTRDYAMSDLEPAGPGGTTPQAVRDAFELAGYAGAGSLVGSAPRAALRSGLGGALNEMPTFRRMVQDEIIRQTAPAGGLENYVRTRVPEGSSGMYPTLSGNIVERTPRTLDVHRGTEGLVRGTIKDFEGRDPRITLSILDEKLRGKGIGSSLYRDFAEEVGGPFRSDTSVSGDASVLYEKMFPKYGYNVMRNPEATYNPTGGMLGRGGWETPGSAEFHHIYRVEPPGMKSEKFYSGGIPMPLQQPEEEQPMRMIPWT